MVQINSYFAQYLRSVVIVRSRPPPPPLGSWSGAFSGVLSGGRRTSLETSVAEKQIFNNTIFRWFSRKYPCHSMAAWHAMIRYSIDSIQQIWAKFTGEDNQQLRLSTAVSIEVCVWKLCQLCLIPWGIFMHLVSILSHNEPEELMPGLC